MQLLTGRMTATAEFPRLSLALARTASEIREVQSLRHRVFIEALGLPLNPNDRGLDCDQFDEICEHLMVRDDHSGEVVGTYRLLSPRAARNFGRYYSESEFDLGSLSELRPVMAEAGRACVHPDYRGGAVISLLWSGLAAFMAREKSQYLIGCASISLADGGHNAGAVYESVRQRHLAPQSFRVQARTPFPLPEQAASQEAWLPPLIKGYLRSGAWVGGEPAWDTEFHTADLFMILPMAKLERRYARHYLRGEPALQ